MDKVLCENFNRFQIENQQTIRTLINVVNLFGINSKLQFDD